MNKVDIPSSSDHTTFHNLLQQNLSLKSVFQKHYRTNTHDLYQERNLLKIPNGKMHRLPPALDEYCTHGNEIHNLLTRTSLNLHIKQTRNENGKKKKIKDCRS